MKKNQKTDAGAMMEPESAATSSQQNASHDAKRGPIESVRIGDVSASIWKREHQIRGEQRAFYSVTLERSFRDRDGAYRYTKSFDRDSLGTLLAVIQKADEYLQTLQQEPD